jgi:hypothetical protein
MAAGGHRVTSLDEVPVRRRVYDNGAVTYDWSHDGDKVFVAFRTDGSMKVSIEGRILVVSGSPHTMKGVHNGIKFTNVGLEPASV